MAATSAIIFFIVAFSFFVFCFVVCRFTVGSFVGFRISYKTVREVYLPGTIASIHPKMHIVNTFLHKNTYKRIKT